MPHEAEQGLEEGSRMEWCRLPGCSARTQQIPQFALLGRGLEGGEGRGLWGRMALYPGTK